MTKHPDAKQPQNRQTLAQAQHEVNQNLKKLEVLKPRINRRYERYEQLLRDRDARKASQTSISAPQAHKAAQSSHRRLPSDPAITNETETLAAGDNPDLAVKLAHKEIRRRATQRKATRQAGISEEVEHERRTAGVWGNWEEALTNDDQGLDRDTLSKQMQNVRSQVDGSRRESAQTERGQRSNFRYPTVPEHNAAEDERRRPSIPSYMGMYPSPQAPELPPKDRDISMMEKPPPRPEKHVLESTDDQNKSTPSSTVQQDSKPSTRFTFKPSAYLENGTPLRTIFLPPDLRHQFLSTAASNTRANLETCGILCGTLISNALFISKLVIPDQESTSDTCETINESELFDYVDGEDLMVLGWIHTHPTQTCFMSSRDLHTHGGYQVMMPESIAIVCAPSKGEWGVFRLTDPPGMKTVLNCTQTGLFHPHVESNVYTDALRPGHVYEAKGLEFEVVDLRPH